MRRPSPIIVKVRPLAWLAIVAIGIAYLWLGVETFRFWGAPLWPNKNTVMVSWLIFVALVLFSQIHLLGVWIVCLAYWRGGGRFMWRWWVGGCLVLGYGVQLVNGIQFDLAHVGQTVFDTRTHPGLGTFLTIAAVFPLWIMSAPTEER